MLLREKAEAVEHDRAPTAKKLRQSRSGMADYIREIGKKGDLDIILAVERRFLETDLAEYTNSGGMKGSLEAAMAELTATEKLVEKVRTPESYRSVNEAHSLPKNRIGAVPRDEARQFFSSHAARLLNQDKSRLSDDEKKVIDARKVNMRAAGKAYAELQRRALGLPPAKDRGRDRGMGM